MRLLSDVGLDELRFERLELRCDVENAASARTADRAGFAFEWIDPDAGFFEHVEGWGDGPRGERVYRRLGTRSTG